MSPEFASARHGSSADLLLRVTLRRGPRLLRSVSSLAGAQARWLELRGALGLRVADLDAVAVLDRRAGHRAIAELAWDGAAYGTTPNPAFPESERPLLAGAPQ